MKVLFSFVGNHDPVHDGELGPVLSLLRAREFDVVFLLCTGDAYVERAQTVASDAKEAGITARFYFGRLDLASPVDYEEIYQKLVTVVTQLESQVAHRSPEYSVLLDPGTPQMQTAWFLMVAAGNLDAELLQGVPPRFAGGRYAVRVVNAGSSALPRVLARSESVDDVPPLGDDRPARDGATPRDGTTPRNGTTAHGDAATPGGATAQDTAGGDRTAAGSVQAAGEPEEVAEGPLRAETPWVTSGEEAIIAHSRSLKATIERAVQLAQYDIPILIEGETGTGKELIAKLIHEKSRRNSGAMAAVNCAAITDTIAESELFGHVKGAFTGAVKDRLGHIRAAHNGTLFLDEVGDLPATTQAKLLRVLAENEVTPVGSDKAIPVNVRVIAATNRDLEEMVRDGDFRRDLLERIRQSSLTVAPLRDRREDINPLIDATIKRWNRSYGTERRLSQEARRRLNAFDWPGNVRQLIGAVKEACAITVSGEITVKHLRPEIADPDAGKEHPGFAPRLPESGIDLKTLLFNIEVDLARQALEHSDHNAAAAAKLLGVQAPAFRKAMRERYGLG